MKKTIKNPRWLNSNRTTIACEFQYADGRIGQAVVSNTDRGNPDWIEIMETFGEEVLEKNTEEFTQLEQARKKDQEQRRKEQIETQKTELLFNAKLDVFMIDEVKNSKNTSLKSRIRKAKSIPEVMTFAAALVTLELLELNKKSEIEAVPVPPLEPIAALPLEELVVQTPVEDEPKKKPRGKKKSKE